jgi:hypothetical protein
LWPGAAGLGKRDAGTALGCAIAPPTIPGGKARGRAPALAFAAAGRQALPEVTGAGS